MGVKVAAYCRVSTDSDDQLNSLSYQTQYFTKMIEDNPDYELYRIYPDQGLSGTSWAKRTEFKAMLYDAGIDVFFDRGELRLANSDRIPRFTRILVKDVSRFARDIGAMEIFTRLKMRGVFIDFVTANLSTETMADDILLGILMLLAQSESKDKSVKIMFGQKQGAKNGRILTANKLYGYNYIKDRNELVIIPEEAENIRLMYDLYTSGKGFRLIIQHLTDNGIFTRAGRRFSTQSIRRILANPTYKGWLVRNKLDSPRIFTGRASAIIRPESEWIVHKGRIPAIVSEETFDKAQEVRLSKTSAQQRRGIKMPQSEYAGRIICGKCHTTYTRNTEWKSGTVFFNCGLKKRRGKGACTAPNVRSSVIESVVARVSTLDMPKWFASYRTDVIEMIDFSVKQPLLKRIDSQNAEALAEKHTLLDDAKGKKRRAAELYIEGKFDADHLDTLTERLDTEIEQLTEEIADMSKSNDDIYAEISEVDALISGLENVKLAVGDNEEALRFIKAMIIQQREGKMQIMVQMNFKELIQEHVKGNRKYKDVLYWLDNYEAGNLYDV